MEGCDAVSCSLSASIVIVALSTFGSYSRKRPSLSKQMFRACPHHFRSTAQQRCSTSTSHTTPFASGLRHSKFRYIKFSVFSFFYFRCNRISFDTLRMLFNPGGLFVKYISVLFPAVSLHGYVGHWCDFCSEDELPVSMHWNWQMGRQVTSTHCRFSVFLSRPFASGTAFFLTKRVGISCVLVAVSRFCS